MSERVKHYTLIEHPLAADRLAMLRDAKTDVEQFRRALGQLGLILLQEATRDLQLKKKRVRTPLAPAAAQVLAREILIVPILRAGQGFITLADQLLPEARIGYLGMARNESTLQPEWYLEKLPRGVGRFEVIVCDPMLATGGSAIAAGELLEKRGAKNLRFIHALAAPEGVRALRKRFPKATILTAALDKKLNENGYIVPGLGDAGDRCYGC
jgi:uracil phosphoribosyltransferase